MLVVLAASLAFATPTERIRITEVLPVKRQKPMVEIILSQQKVRAELDLELTTSFLPKVTASVAEKPF